MANRLYHALMRHYFSLQSEHKECMEQLTTLKAILSNSEIMSMNTSKKNKLGQKHLLKIVK